MAGKICMPEVPPNMEELARLIEMARKLIDEACWMGDLAKTEPSDRFRPHQVRGY